MVLVMPRESGTCPHCKQGVWIGSRRRTLSHRLIEMTRSLYPKDKGRCPGVGRTALPSEGKVAVSLNAVRKRPRGPLF